MTSEPKKTLADLAAEHGMTREEFAQQLAKELPAFLRTLSDIYDRLPESTRKAVMDHSDIINRL